MSLSIRQPQLWLYNFRLIGPNYAFKMTSKMCAWAYVSVCVRWCVRSSARWESSRGNMRERERKLTLNLLLSHLSVNFTLVTFFAPMFRCESIDWPLLLHERIQPCLDGSCGWGLCTRRLLECHFPAAVRKVWTTSEAPNPQQAKMMSLIRSTMPSEINCKGFKSAVWFGRVYLPRYFWSLKK